MATDLYANIEATIRLFLSSYEDAVRQKDPALLTKALSPDCLRSVRPADFVRMMGMDPTKPMDNASYAQHMAPQFAAMEDGKCVIVSTTVDTVKKSATAHVEHHCKAAGQDWLVVEFCWMLEFTEDGKSVKKIIEFLDTQGIMKFAQMLQPPSST